MFLLQTLPVLLSVTLFSNAAAVFLYLSGEDVFIRVICPGEKVTYDCVVPEEAVSITWTATPVLENTSIHFSFTTPPDQWILGCSNVSSIQCADFDFQTTLSVGPVGTNSTSAEFLVSTITYTATAELNGTVFECIGVTENGTERDWIRLTFDKTILPLSPGRPSYTAQQYGRENVTIKVQWRSSRNSESANYTITVSPGYSVFTTNETSVAVTLPYNVMHTVSIVATNCNGNSSTAVETIRIANCSNPNPLGNGSIEAFQNTTEGAEIFFGCDPGFAPAGRMRAVCTSDGRWNPDPATHMCISNCSNPNPLGNGSIEAFQNTTEGTEIFFGCDTGFAPAGRMRAVCTSDGRWNPDPATHMCIFIPVCGDPTPSSGGVTVGPYNSTEVNSVIFYLCNQSGYAPSSSGAVCGEDGSWSPDPSQVVCRIITAPTGETTGELSAGEIAGIVIVLTVLLVVGVVIVGVVWGKKRSYIPSNLQLQSQGADAKPGDSFGVKSDGDTQCLRSSVHSRQGILLSAYEVAEDET